ncbi:MAG: hypothetical protein M3P27_11620 [Acidobacteriota bacterium]|nr:hypothetical protein [Acidobacteriota bacterium]
MAFDDRDLLTVLRTELAFLESGGYERDVPRWRAGLMFEDSPTCLNHANPECRHSCDDCLLSRLAPREGRFTRVPCRHISLDPNGVTVDDLYRTASYAETKQAVWNWLRNTIAQLEMSQPATTKH